MFALADTNSDFADYSPTLIYNNKICRRCPDILRGNVPSRMKHELPENGHRHFPTRTLITTFCMLFLLAGSFSSCYKKEIQFGSDLPDSDTDILAVDTVLPVMSMFVLDSFPTSANNILTIGRCKDPYLGTTTARTFFQLGLPGTTTITDDAIFDSIVLVIRPSEAYYGDTLAAQTYTILESAEQAEYTYEGKLYNTSSLRTHPTPIATLTKALHPSYDSLSFRFPDARGLDFFTKLKDKAEELKDETIWLDYFRGLSIGVDNNDNGAVYNFADTSVVLRIHYHTTLPTPEDHEIEFKPTRSSYQFNQVLTDRTGTALEPTYAGQQEFFVTENQPYAFMHTSTGVLLKVKFPSLSNLLTIGETQKILTAALLLKPVEGTFDYGGYRLPPNLFMAQTDLSNLIGYPITDASGSNILYSYPEIDEVYQLNTQYNFLVTHFISYLLGLANPRQVGAFVLEESPGNAKLLNRAVFGSYYLSKYKSRLKITLLTTQ